MESKNNDNSQAGLNRRNFLHACIAAMSAVGGALIAFPILSFFRLPKRIGGATTIELPLADLSEDQAHYFDREGIQIVVIYTNKEAKVFDAACTHLGCVVTWDPNDHVFRCPCHGAIFDEQGQPTSGPVNKPLKEIKFQIKDDKIIIA